MSVKQLHEIQFENDNHYNLYLFAQYIGLKVQNPESFVIENQEWRNRYKVSLGEHAFYIPTELLPQFFLKLEKDGFEEMHSLLKDQKVIHYLPAVPQATLHAELDPNDPFTQLVGESYLNVDNRLTGLVKAVGAGIQSLVRLINDEMTVVASDTNIVKDFDGIVTFDTPLGKEFKPVLCFDKVPPVSDANHKFVVERTPITPEDLKTYFPNIGEKVQAQLNNIHQLVQSLFDAKAVKENAMLTEYADHGVTQVITRTFLNQTIKYIQFGGKDNWASNGKETPNNVACFKYLDEEVERLFNQLDTIPKEEGVDVYSIDIDTFAIFGRKNNKVVTPALQGYTQPMLDRYSHGFEQVFSQRLAQLDSPHIFKA